jgi:manganese transport protein
VVAAAFIGPGTVTTATVAGARYGTALLWALLLGTLATMALQEMAARLGLMTGRGLGEAIRQRFAAGSLRVLAVGLVISAVAIGNAAYETGNLLGASLGLQGAVGGDARLWALLVGGLASVLLATGSYRVVERVMIALVALMSVMFPLTAVALAPSLAEIARGLFVPSWPDASALWVAVGLLGTTVVPYNLFLHAGAASQRWQGVEDLPSARRDLVLSIAIGGAVSMAILLTAAGTLGAAASASTSGAGPAITSATQMAQSLEPLLGKWAPLAFSVGLFAAGITSSITAPLAAAWATAGALGWPLDLRDRRLHMVWGGIVGVGVVLALIGLRPVPAILFAQAANGILLPAVAIFLLLAANDSRLMGDNANGLGSNLIGGTVVLVALLLGARLLLGALGLI